MVARILKTDDLKNLITSLNTGTDRLEATRFVSDYFYSYAELAAMYGGWLGRRIVDLVPNEALKKGWVFKCPDWDQDKMDKLNSYCESRLQLRSKLLTCLKAQRWAGGAIMLAIVNCEHGSFAEPVPDFLPKGSLLGVQPFDAWQAAPTTIEFMNVLSKNFRLPEAYSIGTVGNVGSANPALSSKGTIVHHSRVERFDGLEMPWYMRERNLYWGQSLLASTYTAVRNSQLVDNSIATLLFRASVPVFKVHDLSNIVADRESREAFMERVNTMNYGMSNNNMAIIDNEETLESFEPGSLTGLDGVLERFYIIVSAATGIPVVKLVGESARGLNATGEGDLNNYYDMLEDYQQVTIKPVLLDMLRRWIVPSLFDELLPNNFDIEFPALERMDDARRQELNSNFISMVQTGLDAGLIDRDVAVREILRKGVFETFTEEDADRVLKNSAAPETELDSALDTMEGIELGVLANELEKSKDKVKGWDEEKEGLLAALRDEDKELAESIWNGNETFRNVVKAALPEFCESLTKIL